MEFTPKIPPRCYEVISGCGREAVTIRDCGSLELDQDEQLTFGAENGSELDITRKEWGYYLGQSINGRLRDFGLRVALVSTSEGKRFLLAVEDSRVPEFERYLGTWDMRRLCWLDSPVLRS